MVAATHTGKQIVIRIKRGEAGKEPFFETFALPYKPNMNVISCLMEIQRNPVTQDGKKTTPVAWDQACLEEVCGSCTMNVNGKVRQACTALIDQLEQPVTLEPMTKFPLVRDLCVDRQTMFENLKRVKAWIPIDGTYDLGPGPREAQSDQQQEYVMSTCMTCGCCVEACPQVNSASDFIGPAAINQVRRFNMHPTGKLNAPERLRAVMGKGGVQECGKAQNCVKVCPKQIPLTSSIAVIERDTVKQAIKDFFSGGDEGAGPAGPM
ncbi:MAG: succinate dehydrogenase iron-sulfur subunit [Deltaproteobacteria bacterium]|nr:succinate dehydrogenase iron-sulfur subunit [Deltaproteobacteria bacterium]